MKIVGFGDSFILGNELHADPDGSLAWPGLIAKELQMPYETLAVGGVGNENIAQQVFEYFASHKNFDDHLVVINWTWSMRWDLWIDQARTWVGLGPTCVPEKLYQLVDHATAESLIRFYKSNLEANSIWNKQRNLLAIQAVQSFLVANEIKNVQTFMDASLWEQGGSELEHYLAYKDPSWPDITTVEQLRSLPQEIYREWIQEYEATHTLPSIKYLQQLTRPQLKTFQGTDFLTWSRNQGFAITELLHPLHQAHREAARYWLPIYQSYLS